MTLLLPWCVNVRKSLRLCFKMLFGFRCFSWLVILLQIFHGSVALAKLTADFVNLRDGMFFLLQVFVCLTVCKLTTTCHCKLYVGMVVVFSCSY